MAIIDFFDRGWRINPAGVAYIQDERSYTFQETGELSCRIANALIAAGFGKEAKGAVWSDNDVTGWTCALGLWRAGMTYIPVNGRNVAEENQYILDFFDCEVLFFQQAFAPVLETMRSQLPKVKQWVCLDGSLPWAPSLPEWCEGQPATAPVLDIGMETMATLSATGGTTGKPKGVMNTHRAY